MAVTPTKLNRETAKLNSYCVYVFQHIWYQELIWDHLAQEDLNIISTLTLNFKAIGGSSNLYAI